MTDKPQIRESQTRAYLNFRMFEEEFHAEYSGKYIVLKNLDFLGVYDTFNSALEKTLKEGKQELGTFIIQRCELDPKRRYEIIYTHFLAIFDKIFRDDSLLDEKIRQKEGNKRYLPRIKLLKLSQEDILERISSDPSENPLMFETKEDDFLPK